MGIGGGTCKDNNLFSSITIASKIVDPDKRFCDVEALEVDEVKPRCIQSCIKSVSIEIIIKKYRDDLYTLVTMS